MYRVLSVLLGVCWLAATAGAAELGQTIEGVRFKDIRYLQRSLDDLGAKRAYVLVFTGTDCPLTQKYLPRLVELDAKYRDQGVQFVAVNSQANESVRDAAAQQLSAGALFPFVKDEDGQLAQAVGAHRTTEAALLDSGKRLVYCGRIDDQFSASGDLAAPQQHDLTRAIEELLADKPVTVAETQAPGAALDLPQPPATRGQVTFHEHVEPILQRRCQSCHHAGNAAPFSLVSYDDCTGHGEMLAEVTADGRMPPWYAGGQYAGAQHAGFANDPTLTAEERATIAAWVRTGMDRGDQSLAPAPLTFPDSKWRIGSPDQIVAMPKAHSVQASGFVPYKYVVLPHVFKQDTWLEAIEILPDNPAVVHHCNMAYLNTKQGAGAQTFITGYVPGGPPMDLRTSLTGLGYLLPANSALVLQIHYTPTGQPERSTISVGLRFPRGVVRKQVHHTIIDPRDFAIAEQHPLYPVSDSATLAHDITLLGMFAHMHLRGRDMTFTARRPGAEPETLLQIPNYNFEWQLGYEIMPGDVRLPKGTVLTATAHYDNSSFNPYNPAPERVVRYGEQTPDEMLNAFFFYTHDDEELSLTIDPQTGHVAAP